MTSTHRPRLLVLDTEPRPRLGRLTGRATVEYTDDSTLAERLPSADVLLVWDFASHAVRKAWPVGGPRPRWVHTASAGVDHLLGPELAADDDTVVTNARGVFEAPIAEYVAALILAMAKDLHAAGSCRGGGSGGTGRGCGWLAAGPAWSAPDRSGGRSRAS